MCKRSKEEIEKCVVMFRLHLYNSFGPYGAKAIRNEMESRYVDPLPSISTIKRILSRNCLTHGRMGYIPGEEID